MNSSRLGNRPSKQRGVESSSLFTFFCTRCALPIEASWDCGRPVCFVGVLRLLGGK